MLNIQPRFLPLTELFENRLFRIPHYQRAYSWKLKQRNDMFEDIKKLEGNPDNSHFMATVVGLRRETKAIVTDNYDIIEIVDGQQRLTTLVILLKAIHLKLLSSVTDADRLERTPEARLERELQELLVKQDDLSLLLLQTNHDSSLYFADFIRNGSCPSVKDAKTLADKELLSAIRECQSFVNQWNNLIELLSIIKNQLSFIFHEIADEASVYTVFEVLNNRGLYVSWLDRFKSMLMAVVFENNRGNSAEHIDELHNIWGKIYATVGLREGLDTEALRFAATLRTSKSVGNPLNEEKSVERLMSLVGTSTRKTIDISKWLLEVTKATNKVYAGSVKPFKEIVIKTIQARLLAVSILLQKFDVGDERKLLNEWESISFQIYVLCKESAKTHAKSERGNYIRLSWEISNVDDFQVNDILERISKLGKPYKFNPYHVLGDVDCYNDWQAELRYLLCRYEEYLSERKGQRFNNEQWNRIWEQSAASSIEHILPQSKGSQHSCQEGAFVHRLGNLLLLPPGLNSELGDKDPVSKTADYDEFGFLDAKKVATIIRNHGWGDQQIENRENEIIKWVELEWGDATESE